jgi:hypothetical protein
MAAGTDDTPPVVFISYSHLDSEWRQRIVSILERRGLSFADDTKLVAGDSWAERLTAMREQARVGILVVTQNFLASETIQGEELPHLLGLLKSGRLRLVPVIAETSNWRAVPSLREIQAFPPDGKPLSSGSQEKTERNLERLGELVLELVGDAGALPTPEAPEVQKPVAEPPASRGRRDWWLDKEIWSLDKEMMIAEVRTVLDRAKARSARRGSQVVHIPDVVLELAALPDGQLSALLAQAGMGLDELNGLQSGPFGLPHDADAEPADEEEDRPLQGFPKISRNVRLALVRARDKADEGGFRSIAESHLLYGALSVGENRVIAALNRRGITPDRVKLPVRSPAPPSRKPLAGYQSDDPAGEDLLGIGKEVDDLASVLAAKSVEPPLSLGLFGDWGSGKTFFMRQLERRIDLLQQDAREAGGESAFCQHIVQLTFNAWNYIDSDLWASLAAEIFEGLAAAIAERRGGDSQEERALVLAAASSSEAVLTEAERKKREAEAELAQSEERLASLRHAKGSIEEKMSPADLLRRVSRFALDQPEVQHELGAAAKALHLPEARGAAGELGGELLALRGFGGTIWFVLRNRQRLWIWLLALGVALAVGVWLVPLVIGSAAGQLVKGAGGLLGGVAAFLAPFIAWARKAQGFIDRARSASERVIEEQRQRQTAELAAEHNRIKERMAQASGDVKAAAETLREVDSRLQKLLADRRMADYIRQRHESSDYTRRLGVIARVRGDFRYLSCLLRDARKESEQEATEVEKRIRARLAEEEGKRGSVIFPTIDRIILYIDDLDRCPEKAVVEVLQAVHLLLAFPLFIVVVGVDPRWLLRSLQSHSASFQVADDDEDGGAPSADDLHWQSTPLNYLEKIFQIPFTLLPIDEAGFGNLVDSFAAGQPSATAPPAVEGRGVTSRQAVAPGGAVPAPPAGAGAAETGKSDVAAPKAGAVEPTPPAAAVEAPPAPAKVADPPGTATIDRHPEHLRIEAWEREFMKKLHELIPSPRAGKRFINVYRLLRAAVTDQERDRFVGDAEIGEYQCALLLLAILTGYPTQATEILRALLEEEHHEMWRDFIAAYKTSIVAQVEAATRERAVKTAATKGSGDGTAAVSEPRREAPAAPPAELERALELIARLERLEGHFGVRYCGDFKPWAARVARFSFQSGRVLLQRSSWRTAAGGAG